MPTNNKINVCRYTPGSPLQAQFNAIFFNSPCSTSTNPPLRDNTPFTSRINNASVYPPSAQFANIGTSLGMSGVSSAQPAVHEVQNSTDAEACLQRLNNSTITRWGLAINRVDRGVNGDQRFIKIGGIAPSLENVFNGSAYENWTQRTIQWRTSPYIAGINNVPSAAQLALLQGFRGWSGWPDYNAQLNGSIVGISYPVGNFAMNQAPVYPLDLNAPVAGYQRVTGSRPDTCAVPSPR